MNEYKIGDKVRIKERKGAINDYPYNFIDDMAQQKGEIFTIKEINEAFHDFKGCKFYNGDTYYYLFEEDAGHYWWHSSMFEPVTEKENMNYHYGDSIKVLEYSGIISGTTCFFVIFHVAGIMSENVCLKIKEKCSDFYKIAEDIGAIKDTITDVCFPEFPTIEKLVAFVNKINELYSQKPSGESKQLLTTQKIKENEIRFQKPKASYIRGNVPTGRAICGRRNKTAIEFGHLSNQACYF